MKNNLKIINFICRMRKFDEFETTYTNRQTNSSAKQSNFATKNIKSLLVVNFDNFCNYP